MEKESISMLMEMFYDGEWKDDKKHGKGFFKYASGEKIEADSS